MLPESAIRVDFYDSWVFSFFVVVFCMFVFVLFLLSVVEFFNDGFCFAFFSIRQYSSLYPLYCDIFNNSDIKF